MVQSKLLLQFKEISHFFSQKYDVEKDIQAEFIHQVHSSKVIYIDETTKNLSDIEADGMITKGKRILGVKTADCLPILIYNSKKKIIGAIHAGWKGLTGGILENTVKTLLEINCFPSQIFVAIGPHIKSCCYKVNFDRIEKFAESGIDRNLIVRRKNSDWYLDLGKFASLGLERLGIPMVQIEVSEFCTSCDKSFYSYRRDGDGCRRMISLIGLTL